MIGAADFSEALRPLLARSAGYALTLLGDRREAEDAVQQAALRAWERRAQFDVKRSFRAWWYAILRNQCLDELRRRARRPRRVDIDEVEASSGRSDTVHDRLVLASAMDRLAPQQSEILRLRYFGDLAYDELAQILDIPRGTVMSRLHLARKALGEAFRREDP